ncbi:MAG TPA: winged helix-turn-helix transcriptional regulator [Methylomirabilota bacterium]|nr:winged helix-turn-helix transcriptional regulator [Methylomirabilota bacterium]
MRSEPCAEIPVSGMVESIVGCKWSVRLLQLCAEGPRRPSAFRRECPGLSAKVLNERLRKMIRFGILERTVFGDKPPVEVQYRLTPFGSRFVQILAEVRRLQEDVERGALAAGPPPGRALAPAARFGRPEPPAPGGAAASGPTGALSEVASVPGARPSSERGSGRRRDRAALEPRSPRAGGGPLTARSWGGGKVRDARAGSGRRDAGRGRPARPGA